jgi:hypothetical protein
LNLEDQSCLWLQASRFLRRIERPKIIRRRDDRC